jgi:hypothetical protein
MGNQFEFKAFLKNHKGVVTDLIRGFARLSSSCASWGNTSISVLPPALFGSYRQCLTASWAESAALTPYMIHFNWLNAGFNAKQQQLKSNGMWLV